MQESGVRTRPRGEIAVYVCVYVCVCVCVCMCVCMCVCVFVCMCGSGIVIRFTMVFKLTGCEFGDK